MSIWENIKQHLNIEFI